MTVYIVTTDKNFLPGNPIVMVDGTVPGWTPRENDLHFDHHRPGGAKVQILEIPDNTIIANDAVFATTQVDADACVAAAWLQLIQIPMFLETCSHSWDCMIAIAYDCDHLGLPIDSKWDTYREFARNAVAAMKLDGENVIAELGLPPNRKEWSEAAKMAYASQCFKRGTEALIEAALGNCPYPGELGEAAKYWADMEAMRPQVEANCFLYQGIAVLDQRPLEGYIDPRILVEWARKQPGHRHVTLTIRSGARQPNAAKTIEAFNYQAIANGQSPILDSDLFSYTLGSVPLHELGSPMFSDRNIWKSLADLEIEVRDPIGMSPPETVWGGRNEVGGSSWRDPMISTFNQVLDRVKTETEGFC